MEKDMNAPALLKVKEKILGKKKMKNPRNTFLGLGRFFGLPLKNFGLFEIPRGCSARPLSRPPLRLHAPTHRPPSCSARPA
jgi:hypothetical protein